MKEKIGSTAGKIWETLRKKEEIEVSNLHKVLKMKSEIVYLGLGWLAHENKINYRTKGNKTFVSLTYFERNIKLN